jgi:hypothetical protein
MQTILIGAYLSTANSPNRKLPTVQTALSRGPEDAVMYARWIGLCTQLNIALDQGCMVVADAGSGTCKEMISAATNKLGVCCG